MGVTPLVAPSPGSTGGVQKCHIITHVKIKTKCKFKPINFDRDPNFQFFK